MRNLKFLELKQYLKTTGIVIRTNKNKIKELMREGEEAGHQQWKTVKLRWEYRHKHIAYSELRGRTREQIENKVAPGNEPNEELIQKFKDEVLEAQEVQKEIA